MAKLAVQRPDIPGTVITYAAASAGGDTFALRPGGILRVKNAHTAPWVVTVELPGTTEYGGALPDPTTTVANGTEVQIGPFDADLVNPADGLIHVTYSGVTALTVAYTAP